MRLTDGRGPLLDRLSGCSGRVHALLLQVIRSHNRSMLRLGLPQNVTFLACITGFFLYSSKYRVILFVELSINERV